MSYPGRAPGGSQDGLENKLKCILTRRSDTFGRPCRHTQTERRGGINPWCFCPILVLELKVSLLRHEAAGKQSLCSHPCWPTCFPWAVPPCTLLLWRSHPPGAHPALPTSFFPAQRKYKEGIHLLCMGGVSSPGQSGPKHPQ